ncbi:MAG: T9SS type A sorting domain-containing protein [Ignavibacteria bacterium]|nr:T9SS type A sorting domain-containing protein [Ignavibacteria bacterium]MBI3765568.1 T9SS type A sorting domain-containing protein [Ignavibacteriales bacterium]
MRIAFFVWVLGAILSCLFLLCTVAPAQSTVPSTLDPTSSEYLSWLTNRKGKPPAREARQIQQVRRGEYEPENSGRPDTPDRYFKNWYTPYDEWPTEQQIKVFQQIKKLKREVDVERSPMSISPWTEKGPYGNEVLNSSPSVYFAGRITALDFNANTGLHVGAASGGLWNFIILGIIPIPVPRNDQLSTLTVGGLAVHPTNPDTIFLGTGEYQGRQGTGVYRTTNGGTDWTLMALPVTPSKVSKVLIPPWSSSIVFVTSDAGIFKSTNNGDTWTRPATWAASDIATTPGGSYMLAGRHWVGVYKSTDYGDTWTQLTTDLPGSDVGRVALAIAPSNFTRAYVAMVSASTKQVLGVFRTDNGNATTPNWTNITPTGGLANYMYGWGWYNNVVEVHPSNSSLVWVAGGTLLKSTNSGGAWTEVGIPTGQLHTDIHALKYRTSDNLFYVGCDGGVFTTDDDGATFSSLINQLLPITQFYNIDVNHSEQKIKYGSSQDNGTEQTSVAAPAKWVFTIGADGIDCAADYSDITTGYRTNQNGSRAKTTNSGGGWGSINSGIANIVDWNTALPLIVQDPFSPSWLYANNRKWVYRTTNGGASWTKLVTDSTLGNVVDVSANSLGTFVYATTTNLTQRLMGFPFSSGSWSKLNISTGLPNRSVKRVCPSMSNSSVAYALMTGLGDNQKIYKTTNNGQNWINITNNFPDVPVNDLVENPTNSSILWVGTDAGAYKTTTAGTSWYRWNTGMPEATIITDMEYAYSTGGNYLVAGTFGRSTYERSAVGSDLVISFSAALVNLGSVLVQRATVESLYVRNLGDDTLHISSVYTRNQNFSIYPSSGEILPRDSLKFYIYVYPFGPPGKIATDIVFNHDAEGSPTMLPAIAYIGDSTTFRTFKPESLIVKKEVKRKTANMSWCFQFTNNIQNRDPATMLHVEFKQAGTRFTNYQPFQQATNVDQRGKVWEFNGGTVTFGDIAAVCGTTKKGKSQQVVRWWWGADGGMLGDASGSMLPDVQSPGLDMPNAANFRKEIFEQYPFGKTQLLVVGVADPNAKTNKLAYVAFAKHGDLLGSLMPGRSGKKHDGPSRCFDYFDNGKEMIGLIKKLTPDKQSNNLFAEDVALKLNIYGSQLRKTPVGFGELRYVDVNSPLNGLLVRQIDSIANVYLTYCDSSGCGSGAHLDSVIHRINCAFDGPRDTVKFAQKLEFTGVRPVAEVSFLERDPSIVPLTVTPSSVAEADVPEEFKLYQNYPNPFNPTTTLSFNLPTPALVTMKVYNILGQEVATLLDHETMDDGLQEVEFNAGSLSSGVYFYRVVVEGIRDVEQDEAMSPAFTAVGKMLLVK